MRTNWASGDKVTAADLNEISAMLAGHDATIAAQQLANDTNELTVSTVNFAELITDK